MNFWNVNIPFRNIKEFYYAAKNEGWKIEIFIDAGMQTEECLNIWMKRKEKQVENSDMKVCPNLSRIFGEMF